MTLQIAGIFLNAESRFIPPRMDESRMPGKLGICANPAIVEKIKIIGTNFNLETMLMLNTITH